MNNSSPFLMPLLALGSSLPILIAVGLVLWGVAVVWRKDRHGLLPVAVVAMFASLFLSDLTFFSAGGGFGPGVGVFFSSIAAAFVAFLLAFLMRLTIEPSSKRTDTLLVCGLIPFCFLAVPVAGMLPNIPCDRLDRETGMALVSALDRYKVDNGAYPKNLDGLVPEYIPALPEGPCHPPANLSYSLIFGRPVNTGVYRICETVNNHTSLAITVTGGGFYQAYDLETRRWRTFDNLDQFCDERQ